jgi:hypothetical protein
MVKKILGCILVANIMPILAGLSTNMDGLTFWVGFNKTWMAEGIFLAAAAFIGLIVWCFSDIDKDMDDIVGPRF